MGVQRLRTFRINKAHWLRVPEMPHKHVETFQESQVLAEQVLSRERKESRKENFVKIPTVTGVILLSKGRPGATRIE